MLPITIYLKKLGEQVARETQAAIKELGELGVAEAKKTTLFKMGQLAEHIVFQPINAFEGHVLADRDYAFYLEEGNDQKGPFIYPVQAKALHFMADGQDVFVTKVRSHHGYHFMETARHQVAQVAEAVIQKHLHKAIQSS